MKFSCYITSYNPNPEWIKRAIRSCSVFDELIVIDNGSTTPIEGATFRFEENQGRWGGRNKGVELTTGDIVCSLDDDDYWIEESVIHLKKQIEGSPADMWYYPIYEFGERNGITNANVNPLEVLQSSNIIPCGAFFRRKVWEDVGGFKPVEAEDWMFWLEAQRAGKNFEYFGEPTYMHRIYEGSSSYGWRGAEYVRIRSELEHALR